MYDQTGDQIELDDAYEKLTIHEAAKKLSALENATVTEDAIRGRIKRNSIKHIKEGRKVFVIIEKNDRSNGSGQPDKDWFSSGRSTSQVSGFNDLSDVVEVRVQNSRLKAENEQYRKQIEQLERQVANLNASQKELIETNKELVEVQKRNQVLEQKSQEILGQLGTFINKQHDQLQPVIDQTETSQPTKKGIWKRLMG